MFEGLKFKWKIIKEMFINSADLINNEIDIYQAQVKKTKEQKNDEYKKNVK